jgi:hypothetical protein
MSEGALTRRYPRTDDGIHVVSITNLPSDQQVSTISTVSTIGWLEVIEVEKYVYRREVMAPNRGFGGFRGYQQVRDLRGYEIGSHADTVSTKSHGKVRP